MKRQAERCTKEHVALHIKRQRALGERMIGDNDEPHWSELIVTMIVVVTAGYLLLQVWQ